MDRSICIYFGTNIIKCSVKYCQTVICHDITIRTLLFLSLCSVIVLVFVISNKTGLQENSQSYDLRYYLIEEKFLPYFIFGVIS